MDIDTIRFVVRQLIVESVALFCFVIVLCVMSVYFIVFVSFIKEEIGCHIKKICPLLAPGAIVIVENALSWQATAMFCCVIGCSVLFVAKALFPKVNST
jgi:hypothetical protein